MTQVYQSAYDFIAALTLDADNSVMDWRAIHDSIKGAQPRINRGTLPQCWMWLVEQNNAGYGIFCNIAAMDGRGHEFANVSHLRAHYVDLDNASALQNYMLARDSIPAPSFGVQTSPNKFHAYWTVTPYVSNDYFSNIQRKLAHVFGGDKKIIDATRVMRVPGFYHLKDPSAPYLSVCERLTGFGAQHPVQALEAALSGVTVHETGHQGRHDLGDPELAAPSIEWVQLALDNINPNHLDRNEWLSMTAAIKQAAWSLTTPDVIHDMWARWCAQYEGNDAGENEKLWNSIRNSEVGWRTIRGRVPGVKAALIFGNREIADIPMPEIANAPDVAPIPEFKSEYLDIYEQQEYFKNCVFVIDRGEIMAPNGRFLNASKFNAAYGGKLFVTRSDGSKSTDEPWKAATRCTTWQIPKVDHIRFLPSEPFRAIITDELGRKGVNVYQPAQVRRVKGDVTPFLRHMEHLIPDARDRQILVEYLVHNVKFPGYKIPWAPVIQSTEGAGKGIMKAIMTNAMGRPYVYFPNAKELTNSGSQFNGWMRNRLFILADEIKVDDRRDLIEVLKPMISEELIEIQSKGVDQEIEDNFSNWMFFTNWRDAIPVTKNGRRFCVMYSPLQTNADLINHGLTESYFSNLYNWLKDDGAAIVTDWMLSYPMQRGAIAMRAPETTSTEAAIEASRSPIERLILESVEENVEGFRGGWISVQSVIKRAKAQGTTRGPLTAATVMTVLEMLGYVACGRAPRAYFQEDVSVRSHLYHRDGVMPVDGFAKIQGWE